MAQKVKNLPAVQETWVWSLGREDPLKGMATHSSIFAWRIPWTEEPNGLQSMVLQRVRHEWATNKKKWHWMISSMRPGPYASHSIFKVCLLNPKMCGENKACKTASITAETGQDWNPRPATWIRPFEHTGSAYNFNIYLLNKVECPSADYSRLHWPLWNITS